MRAARDAARGAVRGRIEKSVAMKDALRIDTSGDLATIALKLFARVVVLSAAMWLALALVSLRFDISGSFANLPYSRLIIGGATPAVGADIAVYAAPLRGCLTIDAGSAGVSPATSEARID